MCSTSCKRPFPACRLDAHKRTKRNALKKSLAPSTGRNLGTLGRDTRGALTGSLFSFPPNHHHRHQQHQKCSLLFEHVLPFDQPLIVTSVQVPQLEPTLFVPLHISPTHHIWQPRRRPLSFKPSQQQIMAIYPPLNPLSLPKWTFSTL